MYAEITETPQERGRYVLRHAGGLQFYRNATNTGVCRGVLSTENNFYTVFGNTLYRLQRNSGNAISIIGSIPSTGHVPMAYNGNQLVCVADGRGFIYTESTSGFAEITDADFLPAVDVTFMDGYFIFIARNSDVLFHSDLYDGFSYNASDRIKIQRNPDRNVAIESMYSELWVFGRSTTELLQNVGASSPAFAPISNTVIEVGCAAVATVVRIPAVGIMWLGNDRIVHLRTAQGIERVTPHEIANLITAIPTISDAVAWHYRYGGHKFYVLTFPQGGCTLVYDITDNLWHERTTYGQKHWLGLYGAHYDDKILVGDGFSSKIHQLKHDYYKDDTEVIRRRITLPEIHAGGNSITIRRLRLKMKVGGGDYTPSDSLRLYASDDSGMNFDFLQEVNFAEGGQYRKIIEFSNLGNYQDGVVFRLETSEQSPIEIITGYIQVEQNDY